MLGLTCTGKSYQHTDSCEVTGHKLILEHFYLAYEKLDSLIHFLLHLPQ